MVLGDLFASIATFFQEFFTGFLGDLITTLFGGIFPDA